MKKVIWLFSFVVMIGLINCGGSSSKEAKELLQKILNLVGIPQNIVVNICQDGNGNGLCEQLEIKEKLTIQKGSSFSDILNKITHTEEGKYLLETNTSELPLLLVIKDGESEFYTKEFTIPFKGLKREQTEKDLSLLDAMVDAGYLTGESIVPIKELNNSEIFHQKLLKDFEDNLKILDTKPLSSPRAVLANIKEVADELKIAGIETNLSNQIESCGDDEACVEERIKEVVITEDEAVVIEKDETSTHKKLLASKVFYNSYKNEEVKKMQIKKVDNESNIQIEKVTFNDKADALNWIVTKGINKGVSGTNSVIIEGSKLNIIGKNIFYFLKETKDYELYRDSKGNIIKYFFDEVKAIEDYNPNNTLSLYDSNISDENSSNDTKLKYTEKFLLGKVFYIIKDDNTYFAVKYSDTYGKRYLGDLGTFDLNSSTVENYTIDENGEIIVNNNIIVKLISKKEDYDEIQVTVKSENKVYHERAYSDRKKAEKYLDTLIVKNNEFNQKMIQNKMIFSHFFTDTDGTRGYSRIRYFSETTASIRLVYTTPEENTSISDSTNAYIIEDGKIRLNVGSGYVYFVLKSEESNGWEVKEEQDHNKDNIIDESNEFFQYFTKPSDFPNELLE